MSVKLAYQSEREYNNSKGIILRATFTGKYGTQTVGDLLNLTPSQNQGVDGGISDPKAAYNHILQEPPTTVAILNQNIGGSYVAIIPNAVPTLTNFGLAMYEPGGTEKATAAVYTAPELAGYVDIEVLIPLQ
jgi:hypothetical protein